MVGSLGVATWHSATSAFSILDIQGNTIDTNCTPLLLLTCLFQRYLWPFLCWLLTAESTSCLSCSVTLRQVCMLKISPLIVVSIMISKDRSDAPISRQADTSVASAEISARLFSDVNLSNELSTFSMSDEVAVCGLMLQLQPCFCASDKER